MAWHKHFHLSGQVYDVLSIIACCYFFFQGVVNGNTQENDLFCFAHNTECGNQPTGKTTHWLQGMMESLKQQKVT